MDHDINDTPSPKFKQKEGRRCYYNIHSRKCRSLLSTLIYIFEDTIRIIIILYFGSLLPRSLIICEWHNTWWCPGDWLTYPVIFLSFTITTFFSLYQYNKWKTNSICYTILLYPFLYLCVIGGMGFVPYSSAKSYGQDMFGLEKYSKFSKFSKNKSNKIIKYIFNYPKLYFNKKIKFNILSLNYYLLSLQKNNENILQNRSNDNIVQILANGQINGKILQNISWRDFRKITSNRKDFHLLFAILVDISIMIYRLFEASMMIYVYINNNHNDDDDMKHHNHDRDLLIIYLISKILAILLFIIEFPMGFILFHIVLDKPEIEQVFKDLNTKMIVVDNGYPKFDKVVNVIEEILDDRKVHIKQALLDRDDVIEETIDIILKYINPDTLPIDGNIDDILEIVEKHRG